jgi:DNA-binding response OmpR family regulator
MGNSIMSESSRSIAIVVVEDDPEVRNILCSGFVAEKYEVFEASGSAELLDILERHPIDLITLDLTLGTEDGLALARRIRSSRNIPIVMITAKSDLVDRVVGLELGADDYIPKPFHMREVLARVRAILRRYEKSTIPDAASAQDRYGFEGWILDIGKRELLNPDGRVCDLTTAEFNLLAILVKRPRRVLTRDEIMDRLKGHEWAPLDRTIDALVARLRRKIEPDSETPRILKTVRGVGYAFAIDVTRL